MRITVTVFVILISTYIVNASVLDPVIENVIHLKASKPPSGVAGIWKKKTIWKPRWVKEWKSAKVIKPVWRKVWSPVQIREWLPIPKPPPGWDSASTPLALLHPKPQKTVIKDTQGHDSFPLQSATTLPLWDPVPYPESQQPPPPPPFPQPLRNTDGSCGKGGCDNSPSHSFNHQQILEILGPRYQTPEYIPNPEYSETVNHQTRIPPEGSNWGQPPVLQDNRFTNFPSLPEFLIPPKSLQFQNAQSNPPSQPYGFQSTSHWTPLPPENNIKGHFITKAPENPFKLQLPDIEIRGQNNTNIRGNDLKGQPNVQNQNNTQKSGDFIQEAQLVGEYHYSEFDFPNVKLNPPQQNQENFKQKEKSKTGEREGAPRGVTNQRPPEQKQRQTKPEVHNPQTGQHIQKKHISNPSEKINNFHNQEALIKEIFPIFKPLPNKNNTQNPTNTQHPVQQSTKLEAVSLPQHPPNQTLKDIYPIYESPQKLPPNFFPPNHRFLLPSDSKPLSGNHSNTEEPLSNHKTETLKPENLSSHKTNNVQLVFATTPVDYNTSLEELQRTTTTEPYEIVFSSSLQSTTETVTKTPVVIVTPIGLKS